jgi:hypothetical protein
MAVDNGVKESLQIFCVYFRGPHYGKKIKYSLSMACLISVL